VMGLFLHCRPTALNFRETKIEQSLSAKGSSRQPRIILGQIGEHWATSWDKSKLVVLLDLVRSMADPMCRRKPAPGAGSDASQSELSAKRFNNNP
jgi:hypothetical protein